MIGGGAIDRLFRAERKATDGLESEGGVLGSARGAAYGIADRQTGRQAGRSTH